MTASRVCVPLYLVVFAFADAGCGGNGGGGDPPPAGDQDETPRYGLTARVNQVNCVPEVLVPGQPVQVPALVSLTGCYADIATHKPSAEMIPYDLRLALWVDGEHKKRYFSIPPGTTIGFTDTGAWVMPVGTVMMKEFYVNDVSGDMSTEHLLETRFFVHDPDKWRGYSFMWRADGSDADLLATQEVGTYDVMVDGEPETHRHLFPSRINCLKCHPVEAGSVLGLHTPMMNRDLAYANGSDNQIRALNHIGMFTTPIDESAIAGMAAYPPVAGSGPLYDRVRSYLHVNCSHCHQPAGSVVSSELDLRWETALLDSAICSAVVPGSPDTSPLWATIHEIAEVPDPLETTMPPLGSFTLDPEAFVIKEWISGLTSCP